MKQSSPLPGTCVVHLVVDSGGNPHNIRVVHSLGLGLDENTLKAVSTWRFEPARRDGKPVNSEVNIEVSFSLDKDDPNLREYLAELKAKATPPPPVLKTVETCPSTSPANERPAKRPHITIAELNLEGARQVPTLDQEQIAASLKERAYFGTVDEVASEVIERVRAAWQDRGFFKVRVTADARILTSTAVSGTTALAVQFDEGQQYRLGSINFKYVSPNVAFPDVDLLRDIFHIRDGEIFGRSKLAQGLDALRAAHLEGGYINFSAVPDARFDDENELANLDVSMDAGKQFFISGVTIIGLDEKTTDSASKELLLQPSDIYNGRYVDIFLHRHPVNQ